MEANPKLFIIAGCNGAGKTTAAFTLLPQIFGCKQFVNADEIARGSRPSTPPPWPSPPGASCSAA